MSGSKMGLVHENDILDRFVELRNDGKTKSFFVTYIKLLKKCESQKDIFEEERSTKIYATELQKTIEGAHNFIFYGFMVFWIVTITYFIVCIISNSHAPIDFFAWLHLNGYMTALGNSVGYSYIISGTFLYFAATKLLGGICGVFKIMITDSDDSERYFY
jgi:hypothetical protein